MHRKAAFSNLKYFHVHGNATAVIYCGIFKQKGYEVGWRTKAVLFSQIISFYTVNLNSL